MFRSYPRHIAADLRKRRRSASAAPTLSAYLPTGIQAPHPADSHGHRPQNHLTYATQQAELCAPKHIQSPRMCAWARQTNRSPAAAITPYPGYQG